MSPNCHRLQTSDWSAALRHVLNFGIWSIRICNVRFQILDGSSSFHIACKLRFLMKSLTKLLLQVFCAIFIFPILMPGDFVRIPIWKKQKWFTTFAQSSWPGLRWKSLVFPAILLVFLRGSSSKTCWNPTAGWNFHHGNDQWIHILITVWSLVSDYSHPLQFNRTKKHRLWTLNFKEVWNFRICFRDS